jgi:hypothetical protein
MTFRTANQPEQYGRMAANWQTGLPAITAGALLAWYFREDFSGFLARPFAMRRNPAGPGVVRIR